MKQIGSFNDYLTKQTGYGIVWNGVYHINDEDLDKLTTKYTSKFKEYWDPNTKSYYSKFYNYKMFDMATLF